jgi:hypothetical protein
MRFTSAFLVLLLSGCGNTPTPSAKNKKKTGIGKHTSSVVGESGEIDVGGIPPKKLSVTSPEVVAVSGAKGATSPEAPIPLEGKPADGVKRLPGIIKPTKRNGKKPGHVRINVDPQISKDVLKRKGVRMMVAKPAAFSAAFQLFTHIRQFRDAIIQIMAKPTIPRKNLTDLQSSILNLFDEEWSEGHVNKKPIKVQTLVELLLKFDSVSEVPNVSSALHHLTKWSNKFLLASGRNEVRVAEYSFLPAVSGRNRLADDNLEDVMDALAIEPYIIRKMRDDFAGLPSVIFVETQNPLHDFFIPKNEVFKLSDNQSFRLVGISLEAPKRPRTTFFLHPDLSEWFVDDGTTVSLSMIRPFGKDLAEILRGTENWTPTTFVYSRDA